MTTPTADLPWWSRLRLWLHCRLVYARHDDRATSPTIDGWTNFTCRRCGRDRVR